MNIYHDLPIYDKDGNLNVVIEVTAGTTAKYEFDKDLNTVVLDRILYTPINFPYNYGFIPQSWNDDDADPLDAIVVASQPIVPAAVVATRVIGYMEVVDSGEQDDKIVTVPVDDPYMKDVQTLDDLREKTKEDYVYFMEHYKDLQGKKCEFKAWHDEEEAKVLINQCRVSYKQKFNQEDDEK